MEMKNNTLTKNALQLNTEALFSAIRNLELENIKDILSKNTLPKLSRLDGCQSACALTISLMNECCERDDSSSTSGDWKKLCDIYTFFVDNGFSLDTNEDIHEITKNKKVLKSVSKINLRLLKPWSDQYLDTLIANSMSSLGSKGDEVIYKKLISDAFKYINEIDLMRPILQIVANSKDFNIVFCFESDNTKQAYLLSTEHNHGLLNSTNKVFYIGAIHLFDENKKKSVYGTLSHELCHFAMEKTFYNHGKPYYEDSSDEMLKFKDVIEECRDKQMLEPIVGAVFDEDNHYDDNKIAAETIVRVPHMLTLYNDEPDILSLCRTNFKKLFDFYDNFVSHKINLRCEMVQEKYQVEELNKSLAVLDKVMSNDIKFIASDDLDIETSFNKINYIKTNNSLVTMVSYHKNSKRQKNFPFNVIYSNMKTLTRNDKFKNMFLNVMNGKLLPFAVIDCKGETKEDMQSFVEDLQKKNVISKVTILTDNLIPEVNLEVNHNWSDFSDDAMFDLERKQIVDFQGEKMTLEEVIETLDTEVLNDIPLEFFLREKIVIGEEIKKNTITNIVNRKIKVNPNNIELESSQAAITLELNKNVIFSDECYSGKTTEMKIIAQAYKKHFNSYWVVYLELKRLTSILEKFSHIAWSGNTILEFLCSSLSQVSQISKLDEIVLEKKFFSNKVIIFFDAFEKICPKYKNLVLNLITAVISVSKNCLWVSTRPNYETDLMTAMPGSKIVKLIRMSDGDKKQFLRGILNCGNRENCETLKKIQKLFDIFGDDMDPLMLNVISIKASEDKDLFFPINSDEINLFKIWESLVLNINQKMVGNGNIPSSEIALIMNSEIFINVYYKAAFRTLEIGGFDLFFPTGFKFSVEWLTRGGLIYKNSSGEFLFRQKGLAEYFMAKFLVQKIFCFDAKLHEVKWLIQIFVHFLKKFEETRVIKMVDGALESTLSDIPEQLKNDRYKILKKICKTKVSDESVQVKLFETGSTKILRKLKVNE